MLLIIVQSIIRFPCSLYLIRMVHGQIIDWRQGIDQFCHMVYFFLQCIQAFLRCHKFCKCLCRYLIFQILLQIIQRFVSLTGLFYRCLIHKQDLVCCRKIIQLLVHFFHCILLY